MENGEPTISRASRGRDGTIAPFSVIAIHDGYQAEMQVNHAFTWLHQSFSADLRMSFNSWAFEKLVAALDIRAMSVRIGTEADMIIIATSSGEPLPDHIKRWLDSIIWRQDKDRAMVLALEPDAHSPCAHINALCENLQQWAARWQAKLICCADIHHPPIRQSILRLINDRFHQTLPADSDETYMEPEASQPRTLHQTMNKCQHTMPPELIQEVRGLAYHLWLQADRPQGKEIDFWLRAEQQVIQAAAEKAAHESTLKTAPVARSATTKPKPKAKHTK
jgi:hypothetical protein